MCLGIPGQVVGFVDGNDQLAWVDVTGVERPINLGVLGEDERVEPGDWVLIHLGFAMEVIDEDKAAVALEGLELMGQRAEQAGAPSQPDEPGPTAPDWLREETA